MFDSVNNFFPVFPVVLGPFKSKIGDLFCLAFLYQILKHVCIKIYTHNDTYVTRH